MHIIIFCIHLEVAAILGTTLAVKICFCISHKYAYYFFYTFTGSSNFKYNVLWLKYAYAFRI